MTEHETENPQIQYEKLVAEVRSLGRETRSGRYLKDLDGFRQKSMAIARRIMDLYETDVPRAKVDKLNSMYTKADTIHQGSTEDTIEVLA